MRAIRSPYLERLCLRGKFTVTDPARVKGLTISVDYQGGAVVYVNGQEMARGHLAAGAAMAEEYPLEASSTPMASSSACVATRPCSEPRSLPTCSSESGPRAETPVAVPAAAIHAGLNVVAVELVRAPYHKVVDEQMAILDNHNKSKIEDLSWNTCEIKRGRLTAAGAEGLVPAASRAAGFELWNSNPLAIDYDLDQGEAGPLYPIRLAGARNGAYSGKVVLGSDRPILGLAATAGDLKGEGGSIPAADVQVRYAMPGGNVIITSPACNEALPYPAVPRPLLELYETAPKEIPVYSKAGERSLPEGRRAPPPVFGAVVPIWVTVKVPKDARPGVYAGQVTLSAEGLKPTPVAVTVKVLDWTIPDPQQPAPGWN